MRSLPPSFEKYWQAWTAAAFLLLLALTLVAFHPGLGGELIFDDVANFQPWKELGDIDSAEKAWQFAASGKGTPGRPLSLLSFLVDDQSWSPDIRALKRTNLALHLINVCLVAWLCLAVFRRLLVSQSPGRQACLALFAASIWALHPLQVSNVSYIIQRMNLLSTLLELAGMVLFLHGRALLERAPRRALLLCTGAAALMPVAVLAKENGLLLCAFLLLIERFCFAPAPQRWWRYWKFVCLWLPLLAFSGYCLLHYRGFTAGFATRDFNAWERLLTQGPVLLDYLHKLLLPRLHGTGLYFDNFPVSRSLLSPPLTLLAWTLLAFLLGLALWLRKRLPLVAFGLFFYFIGHLMESTLLPLELYYEHRNYLPQAGLWMALAGLVASLHASFAQRLAAGTAVLLLALLFMLTRSNAALWSEPQLQAAVWYHENPGSLRASLAYARLLHEAGRFDELDAHLNEARRSHPDSLAIVVAQRFVDCYWRDRPTRFDDLPALARHADYEVASITMLEDMQAINRRRGPGHTGGCQRPSSREIVAIYRELMQNPPFRDSRLRATMAELIAEAAVDERNLNEAMFYYDAAFASEKKALYPYRQAVILESAGLTEEALAYIERAEAALSPKQRLFFPQLPGRIAELHAHLLSTRDTAPSSPAKRP